MLSNQNINVKNPVSSFEQTISKTQISVSDEQTIDDVLKELEKQGGGDISQDQSVNLNRITEEKNTQKMVDSLVEQIKSTESENESALPEINKEQIKMENGGGNQENPPLSASEGEPTDGSEEKFLEPLKNAKFEYEKLGQSDDEREIIGATTIKTYLNWVKKAREALKNATADDHSKILDFVPKRIREQIKGKPASAESSGVVKVKIQEGSLKFTEKNSEGLTESQTKKGDEKLQERISRIDERIKKLNEEKTEYIEELLPLETKKALIKEEIKDTPDKTFEVGAMPADLSGGQVSEDGEQDDEKLEQERSTEDLINKSSFTNKAPVASPKKEKSLRLKKAQLAKEVETPPLSASEGKEDKNLTAGTSNDLPTGGENAPEKKTEAVSENISKEQEKKYVYTDEQLRAADVIRKEFWKKLSSITVSEWYQSPSKNRDFVNKQIIQLTETISGKTPAQVDMEDIQTARLFIFNKAPRKILKHPAFSYVESFYNYQSFQGCIGINPEKPDRGQKDALAKTNMSSMLETNTDKNFSIKQASNETLNKKAGHWDNILLN